MLDLTGLREASVVAVDCEASGLFPDDGARVSCVACAWEGGSIGLPFDQGARDKLGTGVQIGLWEEEDQNLAEGDFDQLLLLLADKHLVFHNGGYDMQMLLAGTRQVKGVDLSSRLYWDTMIAHRVLFPLSSAGLNNAAREMGVGGKQGRDDAEAWLKAHKFNKNKLDLVPWDVIEPYVVTDAEITLALFHAQQNSLDDLEEEQDPTTAQLDREFELAKVLFQLECRGVAYDHDRSLASAEILEERANAVAKGMPFEVAPNAAKKYFLAQGLVFDRYTEKGAPSLDEEQVRDWKAKGVPWAKEYAEVSKARRAVSMWYRGYVEKAGEDGRLRCRYKHGTVASGRLSVERIQLQAMPKADKIEEGVDGVRDLLLARDGYQLWSLDMQQAELRVAAKYAKCQSMLDALLTGADFHGQTNERVLKSHREDPDWKLKRDIAKRLTFGSIFQIGGKKFQETLAKLADIHWELEDCERAVREWRTAYPEFGVAYRRAERAFESRRYMRILPGTEYESKSWLGPRDWPHTGWNRMVQGSLAAWLRMWLVMVEKEWPGLLVLTVHDSIVLEIPEDEAEGVTKDVVDKCSVVASELFRVEMPIERELYYAKPEED